VFNILEFLSFELLFKLVKIDHRQKQERDKPINYVEESLIKLQAAEGVCQILAVEEAKAVPRVVRKRERK
jgi:hypothetical protein